MSVAVPSSMPPAYDWRSALGEVPLPPRKPGQTTRVHPLTTALAQRSHKKSATLVLTQALMACEGRLDWLSEMLGCSWHCAGRLVKAAGLRELAGTLRLDHGHPGPTGQGIAPRKPRGMTGG